MEATFFPPLFNLTLTFSLHNIFPTILCLLLNVPLFTTSGLRQPTTALPLYEVKILKVTDAEL